MCHNCGKPGHFAKECWKRVNQIEEQQVTNPGPAIQYASVKMVRLETPPEAASLEVFDLTTPRQNGEEDTHPWRVGMVSIEDESEEFYEIEEDEYKECHEPTVDVPRHVAIVAMELQDEELEVNMVKLEETGDDDTCLVTLDSGADISVLPREFAGVGTSVASSGELKIVDAQGRRIAYDGLTRARVRIKDRAGKTIELVEEFALGAVHRPILCAGRLLQRGWSLGGVEGQLHLKHEEMHRDPIEHREEFLAVRSKDLCSEVSINAA